MIKRYKVFYDNNNDCNCDVEEHPHGTYVEYDDYMTEVKLFGEEIDQKNMEINKLREEIDVLNIEIGYNNILKYIKEKMGKL